MTSAQPENTPAERAQSAKAQRVRLMLLAAIVAVIAMSAVLYFKIEDRKSMKAAAAQGPESQAERALTEADRAVVNQDFAQARQAFTRAATALDEALKGKGRDLKLLRIRMSVDDRLAYLDQREARLDWAVEHATAARDRARAILTLSITDERSRMDRLSTAQRLREVLEKSERPVEARQALFEAAEAVEATLETLPPDQSTRVALSEAWQGVAALGASGAEATKAHARAIAHAEEALKGAHEPIGALDHLYSVLSLALEDSADARHGARLKRAIQVLRLRLELKAGDRAARRALAGRLSQQAKAREGAEAEALYGESITLRRALLEGAPDDGEARADLAVALSQLARHHGAASADTKSRDAYAEAVEVARPLKASHPDLLVKLLGSLAQVLGRMDEMVPSKAAAAEAWSLASGRVDAEGDRTRLMAAVAALRHARLLRADPKPDKKGALKITREGLDLVKGLQRQGGRSKKVKQGLETLLAELR
ncbi:MAG: hypothetical protein ACE366_29645 [Bradymonadia bacterium]